MNQPANDGVGHDPSAASSKTKGKKKERWVIHGTYCDGQTFDTFHC
jgi:hypothetical protein